MSLAPPFRASAPVLLPAGAVAGFGLGLGALAALMPAASVPPLPPLAPVAAMPAPADTGDTAAASRTGWAPLFGFAVPAPAARFEPEPEPAQSPEVYLDLDGYLLQGLVVENEDGYALINTDDGVVLVLPHRRAALLLEYAENVERDVLDPERLADRLAVGKERVRHRPAKQRDLGRRAHIGVGEHRFAAGGGESQGSPKSHRLLWGEPRGPGHVVAGQFRAGTEDGGFEGLV